MIFVFVATLVLAASGTETALLQCKNAFEAQFEAAHAAGADECPAFADAGQCFTNAIISSDAPFETVIREIEDLVLHIVHRQSSCDLTSMPFFKDLDQTNHAALHRKARSVTSTFDLINRLSTQEAARYNIQTTGNAALDALMVRLSVAYGSYTAIVNNIFAVAVARFSTRIAALQGLVTSLRVNADTVITPSISAAQAAITAQLSTETFTRAAVQSQISTSIASLSTTVFGGVSTAIADRSNIRSTISSNNPANSVSNQLSTQTSTEASRAAVKATTQTTSFNTIQTSMSSSISTSVRSIATFDDAACATAVAGTQWRPQQLASTNDGAACSTAGMYYYSKTAKTIYYCTGSVYTPLIPSLFEGYWQGQTFMTEQQAYQVKLQVGLTQTWTLCWRSSLHGNLASTYRANCGNKGSTTMLLGKSTDGRIWGAWTNVVITGTCNGCWYGQSAQNCWWWRFNPYAPTEIQILNQYQTSTCIYENSNYCPYYYDGRFQLGTGGTCNAVYYDSYSNYFINPYSGDANKAFNQGSNAGYFATTGTTTIVDTEMWYR